MSSYQLNGWIVHPTQCEIVDAKLGTMVQLEPQLMKLLTYLVERQNEVITRDELANTIWPGVAIEDNTISRAITRLRKTLNDDYRQPQYIKTLPKLGYRLVADVNEYPVLERSGDNLANKSLIGRNSVQSGISNRLLFSLTFTLLVTTALIILVILQLNQTPPIPSPHYDTKPLSSQTGREYSPSFSADGNHFVFVGNNQSETWLYLQQRGQDSAVPLVRLTDPNTKPQWSPIKDSIIYAEQISDRCELILLEKVTSSSMLQKSLMPCKQKMRMRPEWHQQEYAIYFIEEKNIEQIDVEEPPNNSLSQLAYLNIETLQKKAVEVPIPTGKLIYAKFTQDGQHLGLLSSLANQNMRITVLDKNSKNTIAQLSLSYAIEDFVWHPEGDSIIHVGEHPSHKIVRHFFDNTQINIAASEIGYLDEVRNIGNSRNFAVTSLYLDRDLVLLDEGKEVFVINSAYPDYNGVYSRDYSRDHSYDYSYDHSYSGQSLAFASKRSGRAQIWLKRSDNSIHQLSQFQNAYYIYDIVWSPDNKFLMVRANHDIYLFDVSNGRTQKLNLSHQNPQHLGWYSNNKIYYIAKEKNLSDLFLFELESQTTTLLSKDIDQAFYQTETHSWFYSPYQSNAIFVIEARADSESLAQPFAQAPQSLAIYQSENDLVSWQILKESLYVVEKIPQSEMEVLSQIDSKGSRRDFLSRERIGYFNPVAPNRIIITKVTSNESNIIELIAQ